MSSTKQSATEEKPKFETNSKFQYTTPPSPNWVPGTGATSDDWKHHKKISLDPYANSRTPVSNYKLLTSAITPRPIGFVSTVSVDGTSRNLAPFSYFNLANHDPPLFTLGLSGGPGRLKDTCRNILETKECTISIISEWFIEAANYTCTDAPSDVDEWELAGLTPLPSMKVKPEHVAESAFSVECKLVTHHKWFSKLEPERQTGTLLILEGVNFHVREDMVVDPEGFTGLDPEKLKPVARMGGVLYTRSREGFELGRPDYKTDVQPVVDSAENTD
ncbi:unnamed protein product [Ambrosiozyma monospora]|uniref:Unnamed protein product n=1 Tax=Ambrosiozyma monospora TaxID=43982 RepID=A0ACB5SV26_AMBMO|nr:unnamed protein product [Ambrosiozyma monospora]